MSEEFGYGGGFALLVVLFILLIIIGASWGYGGFY
ncbi:YjcZ family sporulation protein [Robertmurraya yapensis]|uniref:YjcZ family sporulation protein n=2 Tax=Bacillaceae TaxID=186817 RepID=A0A431WA58_9BACI|nr:YjcZ family sporulation protein [Bacillus yapensis]RTR32312.1 YjcZ family sporulation protein [Bacillus yapensis]TKS96506.1 YjcZ family sporulation protein [Bacillus yapensis]